MVGNELTARVGSEARDLKGEGTSFVTATLFNGISSEIQLSLKNGPPVFVTPFIILERETLKKVIEGPNLPPVVRENSTL